MDRSGWAVCNIGFRRSHTLINLGEMASNISTRRLGSVTVSPSRAAVVICDMWDDHHCVSAAARVVEMAPRMNQVVARLRDKGALIVHAPAGCMDFYSRTAARMRAILAPHAQAP